MFNELRRQVGTLHPVQSASPRTSVSASKQRCEGDSPSGHRYGEIRRPGRVERDARAWAGQELGLTSHDDGLFRQRQGTA